MSLRIERLEFHNFRNYEHFQLNDIQQITVFVGENAVGKTNIIEGISLLTSLSSFRHPRIEHLLFDESPTCEIQQRMIGASRQLDVRMRIEDNRKQYYLNGKSKRTADLKGMLPSVVFTPDDLDFIKSGHSARRNELDLLGSQLSSNHYIIKKDYENVLKHKNRLLKEEANSLLIENINEMIITCGAQLCCYRAALLKKIAPYIKLIYRELSLGKEELEVKYIPSWAGEENKNALLQEFNRENVREMMCSALEMKFSRELDSKRCLVGPHLDHIEFYLNNKDATLFGSQGQQRSIVLSFKLAELMLFQDILKQRPVLLLDDVMSELDFDRRRQLISFIQKDTQVFITTTNMDYFQNSILPDIDEVRLPLGASR